MARVDKTSYIKIDGERLRQAFEKRNLVRNRVAKELGCGCAISNAIARDTISKPLMKLLTSEYGITAEEVAYCSKPSTKEAPKQPDEIIIAPQISEEQWERLGALIKQAILDAFKE